jgi:hypothetical protein
MAGEGISTKVSSNKSAVHQRRFRQALQELSEGRRAPWWVTIHDVAERMGIPIDEAIVLADDCAKAGLVRHDAERAEGTRLPHSVSLRRDR